MSNRIGQFAIMLLPFTNPSLDAEGLQAIQITMKGRR